ncbi:MAG TPA: uroporphyrinogen-III synthase [Actinomycetota bacterium]|nr:uroporphyrinogen-III synthase [Actinomycetota bacterium]
MAERPLAGKVVLVTRPEPRDGPLMAALAARGAEPLSAPAIRIEPSKSQAFARAIRDAAEGRFIWVVFTSPATVAAWSEKAGEIGVDSAALRSRVAAVGSGTRSALLRWGIEPELVPSTFTTAALGRAFPRGEGEVLMPRADVAPLELEEAVRRKGWTPVRVEAYRTRPVRSLPAEARSAMRSGRVDAVTFTSASTVDGFLKVAEIPEGARIVCIGPVTSRAVRQRGLRVDAVARPHTAEGLVEAVERALRSRTRASRSARVRASTRREAR